MRVMRVTIVVQHFYAILMTTSMRESTIIWILNRRIHVNMLRIWLWLLKWRRSILELRHGEIEEVWRACQIKKKIKKSKTLEKSALFHLKRMKSGLLFGNMRTFAAFIPDKDFTSIDADKAKTYIFISSLLGKKRFASQCSYQMFPDALPCH